jgi:hypothetical protein
MARWLTALLLAAALLTAQAWALELPEADYAAKAFGTVAVFQTEQPVPVQGDYGYWSDNLPESLYDAEFLRSTVNAARQAAGQPLLDEATVLYATPGDKLTDAQSIYELTFERLSPGDVRAILAAVDNLSGLLPHAAITFRPLTVTYPYVMTEALNQPLLFDQYGISASFAPGTGVKAMFDKLVPALKAHYGEQSLIEGFYYSESLNADGTGMRSLSFTLDIDPQPVDYSESEEYEG